MKIVVVDDDVDFGREIEKTLVSMGHEVALFNDPNAVLSHLAGAFSDTDLLITDIRMPGMDGFTLLKEVKKRFSQVSVAVMSGHGDITSVINAMRNGAVDYLSKPFRRDAIQNILDRLPKQSLQSLVETNLITAMKNESFYTLRTNNESANMLVSLFRRYFAELCHAIGVNVNEVSVCLMEAMQNAIIHGNMNINSAMKDDFDGESKFWEQVNKAENDENISKLPVDVCIRFEGGNLFVEVKDSGDGFDFENWATTQDDIFSTHGRGLMIMKQIAQELTFKGNGNHVVMKF